MGQHSTQQHTPVESQTVGMNTPKQIPSIPVGALVGSVFGVVFIIILLAVSATLAVMFFKSKRRKSYKLGSSYSKQGIENPVYLGE